MITAVLTYNQSVHSTTGYTPFSLLYGPYDDLNAHELNLDMTVYDNYNEKNYSLFRKDELLPFYEQLYHKTKGSKNIEKLNANKARSIEINEPVVYVAKQRIRKTDPRIRKTDPCFDKVNVTAVDKNKINGVRENSNKSTNIHIRKVKLESGRIQIKVQIYILGKSNELKRNSICRAALTSRNQALQIEKINSNGYFAEKLGLTKLLSHYHKFYFYIDIENIEVSYKTLLGNIVLLGISKNTSSLMQQGISNLEDTCLRNKLPDATRYQQFRRHLPKDRRFIKQVEK
ncbi:hypothetical protein QE152_g38751 [Popillia japonica]|uniref:Integrase catalytic domain-containing protein n=1 Tax=Popillia japonica TaxID=7064 RepID=A0AAW1HWS3_POPJA